MVKKKKTKVKTKKQMEADEHIVSLLELHKLEGVLLKELRKLIPAGGKRGCDVK